MILKSVLVTLVISFLISKLYSVFYWNNACRNYYSYLNSYFSDACYYTPDIDRDVAQIIASHIGECEIHNTTTEDGYILTIFRIPRKHPKETILLQHGTLQDAKIWVGQYNMSIAFLFWKAGYDVWLGNTRGTLYSRKHMNLTHESAKFWDYSMDEIGYYDHKATFEYIKGVTNKSKIIYIGFSMSAATSLIYAIRRPEDAINSIKILINIAPISHFKYISSPGKYILLFLNFLQPFNNLISWYNIVGYDSWYWNLFRIFHSLLPFKKIVTYCLSFFYGWTPEELDPNYINAIFTTCGARTSLKLVYHFAQICKANNFQMYDYGKIKNIKLYGNESPPLYPLGKLNIPIFILHSTNDAVSHPRDVELLYSKLPEKAKIYGKLAVKGLNHLDFFFGKHRQEKVYAEILRLLDNIPK